MQLQEMMMTILTGQAHRKKTPPNSTLSFLCFVSPNDTLLVVKRMWIIATKHSIPKEISHMEFFQLDAVAT